MPQNRTMLNNLTHRSIPNSPKTSVDSHQVFYRARLKGRLWLLAPMIGAVECADKVEKSVDFAF